MNTPFGVHSEVGVLRKVMVCRPGLAHLRSTPDNCKDLLFDDVIWVQEAKNEHYKFVEVMRDRGIDVVDMHDCWRRRWKMPRRARGCSIGRSTPIGWRCSSWTKCARG